MAQVTPSLIEKLPSGLPKKEPIPSHAGNHPSGVPKIQPTSALAKNLPAEVPRTQQTHSLAEKNPSTISKVLLTSSLTGKNPLVVPKKLSTPALAANLPAAEVPEVQPTVPLAGKNPEVQLPYSHPGTRLSAALKIPSVAGNLPSRGSKRNLSERTMHLTPEGVDKVFQLCSFNDTPSFQVFLIDEKGNRKVSVEYVPKLEDSFTEIEEKYGGEKPINMDEFFEIEEENKESVRRIKERLPLLFPKPGRSMNRRQQALILDKTDIRTGFFMIWSTEAKSADLFDAFSDLMKVLNDSMSRFDGTIYANVNFYPNISNSRIQVKCNTENSHRIVLRVLQEALSDRPFTVKYKFDALRYGGCRSFMDNSVIVRNTRVVSAASGLINEDLETIAKQIDEILDMKI